MPIFPTHDNYREYDPVLMAKIVGAFNAAGSYIANDVLATFDNGSADAIANGANPLYSGQILKLAAGTMREDRGDSLLWQLGASAAESAGVDLTDPVTYVTKRYGNKIPVPIGKDEGFIGPGSFSDLQLMKVIEELRVKREIDTAALFTSGNVTDAQTLSGATRWDQAGSDPIDNIKDAVEVVSRSGMEADSAVIGRSAWYALMNNPSLIDRMSTNGNRHGMSRGAFADLLNELFGIKNLYIGMARKNTGKPGGTASESDIWGDSMVIYKKLDMATPADAASGMPGSVAVGGGWALRVAAYDLTIENYLDNDKASIVHRAHFRDIPKVVDAQFASGIFDVVT